MHDIIVVLGYGFVDNWKLPEHVYQRLQKAVELYRNGLAERVVVCGKWSLNWDKEGVIPPLTEAEAMKRELVDLGIKPTDILKEEESKDTIGNAYFLKTTIMKKYAYTHALVLCADYAKDRVAFIFGKIFEPTFDMEIVPTPTPYANDIEVLKAQKDFLTIQQQFLSGMQPGDDGFLASRLYDDPYYRRPRSEKIAFVAKGGAR